VDNNHTENTLQVYGAEDICCGVN